MGYFFYAIGGPGVLVTLSLFGFVGYSRFMEWLDTRKQLRENMTVKSWDEIDDIF